jgi:D-amino-acid dehydrogenase
MMRMVAASRPDRYEAGRIALSTLLAEAMPAWRRLSSSLPRGDLLIEQGHFVVWQDPDAAARGLAAWRQTDTGGARFHAARSEELDRLAGVMARRPAGAIVFENTGQVADPAAVCHTLDQAFSQAGGERRRGLARAITITNDRAELLTQDGDRILPRQILIAAGVESGALMESIGARVPIVAERGYHIQAARHGWPIDMPPVVFEERSMIVTRFESGLRAASFVEFGHIDAPPDPHKWQRLERHVSALGLPVDGPFTRWMGARPTPPDYLPAIGRARQAANLFYAFGHHHLGLTLGPVTGEILAALMTDQPRAMDLERYAVDRFQCRA